MKKSPPPADFIGAWKRIHDRMIASGATQVLWYFCPSEVGGIPYYPGDAYVDYAGWDAYDRNAKGLVATMQPPYLAYAGINKPFIVGETGAEGALDQATYLDGEARAVLATQFPKIVGVEYFDAPGNGYGWTFTPAGLQAFKAFAAPQ